jgi:hypothetical protein
MTAIENHQIKGITIKNVVVTIISTASIVTSVVTSYFGLKTDIQTIKSAQETEAKINGIRIKILEDQAAFLQKEINEIEFSGKINPSSNSAPIKTADPAMLSVIEKK